MQECSQCKQWHRLQQTPTIVSIHSQVSLFLFLFFYEHVNHRYESGKNMQIVFCTFFSSFFDIAMSYTFLTIEQKELNLQTHSTVDLFIPQMMQECVLLHSVCFRFVSFYLYFSKCLSLLHHSLKKEQIVFTPLHPTSERDQKLQERQ